MDKKEVDKYAYNFACNTEVWVQKNIFKDFFLASIRLDWNAKRRSSRGGIYAKGPGINIAMVHAYPARTVNGVIRFREYPSYEKDTVIGSFYTMHKEDKLKATILHEIAHAVQFFSYGVTKTKCTPHGPVFKRYYKTLRENLLNDDLPPVQWHLEKHYLNAINKINKPAR